MLLQLKQLLTAEEVTQARQLLDCDAPWLDGRVSAGSQARTRKCNQQLAQDSAVSRQLHSSKYVKLRKVLTNERLTVGITQAVLAQRLQR